MSIEPVCSTVSCFDYLRRPDSQRINHQIHAPLNSIFSHRIGISKKKSKYSSFKIYEQFTASLYEALCLKEIIIVQK